MDDSKEAGQRASEAVFNVTVPPASAIPYPVILTPDGPISSASKLQELVEMESLPEAIVTSAVNWEGREIGKVTICSLEMEGWARMLKKAIVACTPPESSFVIFEGKRRMAWTVTTLKEGVTLECTN
jgi:hypothetical protein